MEPGTKIAVISKSGEGVTQAPSEKAAVEPPTPEQKQTPDAETAPVKEKIKEVSPSQPKPKGPPPPPKTTASEPQLPPKDRERRVSFRISASHKKIHLPEFSICFSNGKEVLKEYIISSCLGSYDKTQETGCITLERFSEHFCFAEHV